MGDALNWFIERSRSAEQSVVAQVEALQRYRATTEEKAIVQHVSVSDGGQAIVANANGPAHEIALKKPVR